MDKLKHELVRCDRLNSTLTVVLVDLDYFKNINDSYGHPAGDSVVVEVARRFQLVIRPGDSAGRYGVEEFLLLLPGMPGTEVENWVRLLHESVCAAPIEIAPSTTGQIQATCSFGVAFITTETPSLDDTILQADNALYRAKALGRNRIEYAESCHPRRREIAKCVT